MEQLIVPPSLDSSGKAEKPGPKHPAAAPTFLPVKISESGALILDPNQSEDAYVKQLQKLLHSKETLQKAGYVIQPLTELELEQKKKCVRCHKCESIRLYVMPSKFIHPSVLTEWAIVFKKAFKHTLDGKPKPGSDTVVASSTNRGPPGGAADATGKRAQGGERSTKPIANGPKPECKYHKGYFNGRVSP